QQLQAAASALAPRRRGCCFRNRMISRRPGRIAAEAAFPRLGVGRIRTEAGGGPAHPLPGLKVHRAGLAAPALPRCGYSCKAKVVPDAPADWFVKGQKSWRRLSTALILSIGIHIARDRVGRDDFRGTMPSCPANILRLREVVFSGGVDFGQMGT